MVLLKEGRAGILDRVPVLESLIFPVMCISFLSSVRYKGHEIKAVWADNIRGGIGHYWTIDDEDEIGFQSAKDARAFISGLPFRWPVVPLVK